MLGWIRFDLSTSDAMVYKELALTNSKYKYVREQIWPRTEEALCYVLAIKRVQNNTMRSMEMHGKDIPGCPNKHAPV